MDPGRPFDFNEVERIASIKSLRLPKEDESFLIEVIKQFAREMEQLDRKPDQQ